LPNLLWILIWLVPLLLAGATVLLWPALPPSIRLFVTRAYLRIHFGRIVHRFDLVFDYIAAWRPLKTVHRLWSHLKTLYKAAISAGSLFTFGQFVIWLVVTSIKLLSSLNATEISQPPNQLQVVLYESTAAASPVHLMGSFLSFQSVGATTVEPAATATPIPVDSIPATATPPPTVTIDSINDGEPVEGIVVVRGRSIGLAGATLFILVYDLNDGETWPWRRFVVDEDGTINADVRVCFSNAKYRLIVVRGRSREGELALEDRLLNDPTAERDGATLGGIQVQRWTKDFESGPEAHKSPRC
jgi:hypothetical protein